MKEMIYKPPEGKGIIPYEAKNITRNVAAIVLEKAL